MPFLLKNFLNGQTKIPVQIYIRKIDHLKIDALTGHKQLSKGKRARPTMAIATIKYDENNCPKRAKYRLVVLVNLDYHTWSKESTAAPVLS